MQNSKAQNDSKVPFLSSIPLLGNLFKHTAKDNGKTELMIFLTPHIVAEPQQLASLTSSENTKVQIMPGSFSDNDLNTYLDNLPNKIGSTNKVETPKRSKKSK
jgi:type II secretory pathway component GspD/PulD (secretin)